MRFLRAAWFHLRSVFDRSKLDAELDLELRDHIERETRANVARGMPEREARRAAVVAFGGVQRYKEETRATHAVSWLEDGVQDTRYALRALRRAPGFTIVAVLTLALGIGATSAVFTVVDHVLLRPLPFREPNRLYLASFLPRNLGFVIPFGGLTDRTYLAYRERQRAFERVVAYQRAQLTLSGVGDAARLTGAKVGADFFGVLGVTPAYGRPLLPDEERLDAHVVIVSDGLWRERFGADRRIVGKTITLDGKPYAVVGVAPPGFSFPASAAFWIPLPIRVEKNNVWITPVLGRLRSGVTVQQARSELAVIGRSLERDPRDRDDPGIATIVPLEDAITGNVERSLLVFTGAAALVLLIAGVNLANLLLIRASARRQEMALRVSLGASRHRLVRQLLTESVLVSVIGGAIGVLFAFVGVRGLLAMAPPGSIPRIEEVHVDGWILAFTLAVALATGVLFGVFPALDGARRDPHEALAHGVRTAGGARSRARSRFVTAEIALAFVLLAAAGLMIRSFVRMRSVNTGFSAEGVVTMSVDLPGASYPDAVRLRQFHAGLLQRLGRIPGVRATGAVSYRPMGDMGIIGDFRVDGPTPFPHGLSVDKPTASPGYFAAMGIPLLRGRDFSAHDDAGASGVTIVSESVARAVWPNEDAVGKRISMEERPGPGDWLTVIGVVKDVVQDRGLTTHQAIYLPYLQTKQLFFMNHMTFVVRTSPGSPGVAPAMRTALREMDPTVPAQALQTMDASMLALIAEPLFQTRLLATFSLLALALAAIGTYGVLAYDVSERTREIGIRMALGAESNRVLRMVVGRALLFTAAGIAIGGAGAFAANRVLSKFLFEVSPTDTVTFGATAALLAGVALIAGIAPARRAARVDPIVALRQE